MIKKFVYELPALSNNYECPRCGARLKIPLDAPGTTGRGCFYNKKSLY